MPSSPAVDGNDHAEMSCLHPLIRLLGKPEPMVGEQASTAWQGIGVPLLEPGNVFRRDCTCARYTSLFNHMRCDCRGLGLRVRANMHTHERTVQNAPSRPLKRIPSHPPAHEHVPVASSNVLLAAALLLVSTAIQPVCVAVLGSKYGKQAKTAWIEPPIHLDPYLELPTTCREVALTHGRGNRAIARSVRRRIYRLLGPITTTGFASVAGTSSLLNYGAACSAAPISKPLL